MSVPSAFAEYYARQALPPDSAAFVELDADGVVTGVAGAVRLLGGEALALGDDASDALPYLQGLLPLDGSLVLPRVAMSSGVWADVHVFAKHDGYGVLLQDVTGAVTREGELYQRANELALLKRGLTFHARDLKDLFRAVNVVVAEVVEGGRLRPLGGLPDWAGRFVAVFGSSF